MADSTTLETTETISPVVKDIQDKDKAWVNHQQAVRKWEDASKRDKELNVNTAGIKPEPDQAALRGKEFSDMRSEVYNEFNKITNKPDFHQNPSFDKLISKIDKTLNPTDEAVKTAKFLDMISKYLPEISVPAGVKALENCPDALGATSNFKGDIINTLRNVSANVLKNHSESVGKLAEKVLPFTDALSRNEVVEVTGEAVGSQLFKSLLNSESRQISFPDLKAALQQKGINITPDAVPDDQKFNYRGVQDLLANEAVKMTDENSRNKTLGVSLGIMEQVAEWLPAGRDSSNSETYLEIMTNVVNTSDRIKSQSSTPDFVKQKLIRIRSTMQVKRNLW